MVKPKSLAAVTGRALEKGIGAESRADINSLMEALAKQAPKSEGSQKRVLPGASVADGVKRLAAKVGTLAPGNQEPTVILSQPKARAGSARKQLDSSSRFAPHDDLMARSDVREKARAGPPPETPLEVQLGGAGIAASKAQISTLLKSKHLSGRDYICFGGDAQWRTVFSLPGLFFAE